MIYMFFLFCLQIVIKKFEKIPIVKSRKHKIPETRIGFENPEKNRKSRNRFSIIKKIKKRFNKRVLISSTHPAVQHVNSTQNGLSVPHPKNRTPKKPPKKIPKKCLGYQGPK